jgi:hypothetical protein
VKAFRLRSLNAAEAEANQASARQSPVERVRREQHRHRLSNPRHSRNVVGRQREKWARSQVPARLDQAKSRRRDATKDLSVNDSARRRLPTQVKVSSVAEVGRLESVSRSRHRPVAVLQVKHAAKEKERRAPMVSRPSRVAGLRVKRAPQEKECRVRRLNNNNSSSSNDSSRSSEVAHLPARGRGNRKVERREHQKKRHRQGRGDLSQSHQRLRNEKGRSRFFLLWRQPCRLHCHEEAGDTPATTVEATKARRSVSRTLRGGQRMLQ